MSLSAQSLLAGVSRLVSLHTRLWIRQRPAWFHAHVQRHFSTQVERTGLTSGGFAAHLFFYGSKKYPILNPVAIERLVDELGKLDRQHEVRVLFLRSTVVGADIDHMKSLIHSDDAVAFIRSVDKLCSTVQDFRVPVIAVIDGPCMGAGMELAASCDMRIAVRDETTVFAMPETKIGIPSVVQASLLPGLIGWGRARQLLYFGETLDVTQALDVGFLNEVTVRADLPAVLTKWETWVDEAEPRAVMAQKALMRTWEREGTDRAGIEASIRVFGEAFNSGIPQQRMADYARKLKAAKKQKR
ncbi:uncharacterized protein PV09_00533 [Verruconis gallopava]|uniref:Enoyl-CoA hydratase n=1 Tax=Verruconis gallopava TaxID=253628 RepID=A0A0D2APF8_9PEZI|nr:uncharacterized protein PV09_00533 [Verruconis gallopava]KIW08568.1 hypothetical protein PV09_00533 [Verruconis gallopava]